MKNIFNHIKHAYTDNKEHFVRCSFAVVAASLILGLIIGLSVPVSAESSSVPTDLTGYTVTVPAGWSSTAGYGEFSINYDYTSGVSSFSSITMSIGYRFNFDTGSIFPTADYIVILDNNFEVYPSSSFTMNITGGSDASNSSLIQWLVDNGATFTNNSGGGGEEPDDPEQAIIPAGIYNQLGELSVVPYDTLSLSAMNSSYIFYLENYGFDIAPSLIAYGGSEFYVLRVSPVNTFGDVYVDGVPTSFYSYFVAEVAYSEEDIRILSLPSSFADLLGSIVVEENQIVPSLTAEWFDFNYTAQITPEPTQYTISAGYYKVRDSWNISGWPVTNDSIEFRYYDELDQSYIEAEGIAFLIENRDMISIWYMDDNVYLDGWNIKGAKFIEVTQDIVVEPEFYIVFNSVYAPSSEGTNEFDSGYVAGYQDGRDEGYDIGYRQGYAEGLEDGDTNIFTNIIGGTLAAVDSFTIFGGFSLLDLISTLLGGMALVWLLKLLAGG